MISFIALVLRITALAIYCLAYSLSGSCDYRTEAGGGIAAIMIAVCFSEDLL